MKSKKNSTFKKGDLIDHLSFFPQPVIGVDEVGRGCLAGPVYAAAVILNSDEDHSLFDDSKKISASRREPLAKLIKEKHRFCLGFATVQEIDEINILQASLLAMKRAVLGLEVSQGHVLVDGIHRIPGLKGFEQTTIIQGDSRCKPIAAASIVAKVARDNLMKDLALHRPEYKFELHKGYSTALHKDLVRKFGPSEYHRLTFAGVKEYVQKTSLQKLNFKGTVG